MHLLQDSNDPEYRKEEDFGARLSTIGDNNLPQHSFLALVNKVAANIGTHTLVWVLALNSLGNIPRREMAGPYGNSTLTSLRRSFVFHTCTFLFFYKQNKRNVFGSYNISLGWSPRVLLASVLHELPLDSVLLCLSPPHASVRTSFSASTWWWGGCSSSLILPHSSPFGQLCEFFGETWGFWLTRRVRGFQVAKLWPHLVCSCKFPSHLRTKSASPPPTRCEEWRPAFFWCARTVLARETEPGGYTPHAYNTGYALYVIHTHYRYTII